MKDMPGLSELTLDDLAGLKESPVAEELSKIAGQINEEQRHVNGFEFESYV